MDFRWIKAEPQVDYPDVQEIKPSSQAGSSFCGCRLELARLRESMGHVAAKHVYGCENIYTVYVHPIRVITL